MRIKIKRTKIRELIYLSSRQTRKLGHKEIMVTHKMTAFCNVVNK